jgi:hypothetical protein
VRLYPGSAGNADGRHETRAAHLQRADE